MENQKDKFYEEMAKLLNQIILKLSTMPDMRESFNAARTAKETLDNWYEEICITCGGTKEVSSDEDDGEGHMQAGVGTERCPDCLEEPDDFSGASEGDR